MPQYFFDVDDGERHIRDEAGMSLPGLDAVEHETRILLQNLGVPEMLNGQDRLFTAVVRDPDGAMVYRATAALKIDRRPS